MARMEGRVMRRRVGRVKVVVVVEEKEEEDRVIGIIAKSLMRTWD